MFIEKGVVVPPKSRSKWPFADMDIGDSVLLPEHLSKQGQIYCHVYGRASGKEFTSRTENGRVRVWRVA